MSNRRVVVVGQGYVGLPLAVCAAEAGHRVVGYDVEPERIARLAAGDSYVEDIASGRLRAVLADGSFRASADPGDCAGFDLAIVAVPTPLRDGVPDLTYVEESAAMLAGHLVPGATVVLESTTYPGTTEELFGPLLEKGSGLTAGIDFHLGYSPERIDPGNPDWRLENTPKIVSGVDGESLAAVVDFYSGFVRTVVPVASCKEAELAKLLENIFRHVNIGLANELAVLARDLGINIWGVLEAAATKPFGYMPFSPGPGVGGHCLPIDPSYLSWQVERSLGYSFRFVELANDVNSHMPDYVVRRLTEALNSRRRSVNGARVLVLGLAYKKNTSDTRESPALRVVELLSKLGAEIRAADPHVPDDFGAHPGSPLAGVERVEASPAELAAADVVLLLVDHDAFSVEDITEHASHVLDCRGRLRGANVELL
ncbi:nucleotide sugar dehydrogenase [Streptomyces sp. NPDC008163]|uniref:nucleotide sugar dehydrogenase n=1 Tax=Streptomyces sp. NPDC008163 TaxID=3364818 RepID=UPI0036EEE928